MFRGIWFVVLVCLAVIVSLRRTASACSYGPLPSHEIDPAEKAVDTKAPSAIGEITYTVQRGRDPNGGCGRSTEGSSCDDVGGISVHLGEATDDRTTQDELGYRVEVVTGNAPADSTWPTSAVRAVDQTLYFHWVDGNHDDQDALDFTFRIRAVDRAGNEGPPSDVRIRHDGDDGGGCRMARGVDVSWALIAAVLLGLHVRARRRRNTAGQRVSQTPWQA